MRAEPIWPQHAALNDLTRRMPQIDPKYANRDLPQGVLGGLKVMVAFIAWSYMVFPLCVDKTMELMPLDGRGKPLSTGSSMRRHG